MSGQSWAYAALRYLNDVRAVQRAGRTNSLHPIARRLARRAYGKATGHLARKIFR